MDYVYDIGINKYARESKNCRRCTFSGVEQHWELISLRSHIDAIADNKSRLSFVHVNPSCLGVNLTVKEKHIKKVSKIVSRNIKIHRHVSYKRKLILNN